jgi:hypothetical protein
MQSLYWKEFVALCLYGFFHIKHMEHPNLRYKLKMGTKYTIHRQL